MNFLTATSPCPHICHSCKQLYIDKSNGENVQLLKVKTWNDRNKVLACFGFFLLYVSFFYETGELKAERWENIAGIGIWEIRTVESWLRKKKGIEKNWEHLVKSKQQQGGKQHFN